MEHNKTILDSLAPQQAFWLGAITTVLVLGTLGFIILGSCTLKGTCSFNSNGSAPKNTVTDTTPTATGIPVVSKDDHIRGDKNAEVTIIEYSDFECPYCSKFHPTMLEAMNKYEGKIRWIWRHFPLSFHPNAEPAANAAECAADQDKFWEYADLLIANQKNLSVETYKKLAQDLKLDSKKFNACVDNGEHLDEVRAQAKAGAGAGVTGTPGSFVIDKDGNATPIKGALPIESVSAAIDAALAK